MQKWFNYYGTLFKLQTWEKGFHNFKVIFSLFNYENDKITKLCPIFESIKLKFWRHVTVRIIQIILLEFIFTI